MAAAAVVVAVGTLSPDLTRLALTVLAERRAAQAALVRSLLLVERRVAAAAFLLMARMEYPVAVPVELLLSVAVGQRELLDPAPETPDIRAVPVEVEVSSPRHTTMTT